MNDDSTCGRRGLTGIFTADHNVGHVAVDQLSYIESVYLRDNLCMPLTINLWTTTTYLDDDEPHSVAPKALVASMVDATSRSTKNSKKFTKSKSQGEKELITEKELNRLLLKEIVNHRGSPSY